MDPTIVLLLGLVVLIYLNVASRRRAQRRRAEMDQRLVPGAEVVTTSGLHGSVDALDDDGTVLLEIAPGWVTRWERAAVSRVVDVPVDDAPDEDETTPETTADTNPETTAGSTRTTEPSEPVEAPEAVQAPRPAPEPGIEPAAEPGARPLPGNAPPDRA